MKSLIQTTVFKSIALAVISSIATFGIAQTGKVLTTISSMNSTDLSIDSKNEIHALTPEMKEWITAMHITKIEKAFPAAKSEKLVNVYEISCNCDENSLLQEVARKSNFFQRPEIAANPQALFTPNDYTAVISNYALNLINAEGAWDITHGDSMIQIAITDANFNLGHEELIGKFSFVAPNYSSDYTHGTAVAITAAGGTNNQTGISSIGFNSSLQLRAMSYNDVLEASYAGARVINMSWAGSCADNSYYQSVIDEAYNNGSILVAAAGNGGTCGGPENLVYPAAHNHVIAVSSVGPFDNHERTIGNPTTTHQHNASVDLVAPGYDVALSIAPGNYLTGNGSSFAAPYVSGTIALMLAVNPCLTSDQVETILKQTAVNIDDMNPQYIGKLGAGRLDAAAAVQMASTFNTIQLSGEVTFECSTMAQTISLDMSNVAAPYQIAWNNGSTESVLTNVEAGSYSVIVKDSNGCVGIYSTLIDSLTPIVINSVINPVACYGGSTGSIAIEVSGGNSNYTYQWSNGSTTQNIDHLTAGEYQVTVKDGKGCQLDGAMVVNEPTAIQATISHTDLYLGNAGSVNVNVTGGTAPYTFSWNNGQTTEDLSNLTEGFYELLIVDENACVASVNTTVLNSGSPEAVSTENNTLNVANYPNNFSNIHFDDKAQMAGMNEISTSNKVQVYPNPAVLNATISWGEMNVHEIIVFDVSGKLMNNLEVAPAVKSFELTQEIKGEYFLMIIAEDGSRSVKKVEFL